MNTQEQARLLQAAHHMLKAAGTIRVEAQGATPLNPMGGGPRWALLFPWPRALPCWPPRSR